MMSVADLREAVRGTSITEASAEFLRRALGGNGFSLSSAFVWSSTPQGYNHWVRRSADASLLTSEDRAFLMALLLRAHREFRK